MLRYGVLTASLISIHALLAESDIGLTCGGGKIEISIHALLAESDKFGKLKPDIGSLFLSTLSLRRATISHFIPNNGTLHFYPRSPCGERPEKSE